VSYILTVGLNRKGRFLQTASSQFYKPGYQVFLTFMVKRLHPLFSKNKLFTGFLYGLLLSLLTVSGLQAQVVTIPSGNTATNPSDVAITRKPLGNYFGYERSAAIYLSSEIGQTGN